MDNVQGMNNNQTNFNIIIDLDDQETTDISLDNEKPLFTEIYSTVSEKLRMISKEESDLFLTDFESLLKNEISKINQCVEHNSPNYIYATNVLDSVFKILNYFNTKYCTYLQLKDVESAEISKKINDHYFETSAKIVGIINKLYPKIEEETGKVRKVQGMFSYSQGNTETDRRINQLEEKIRNFKNEKELLIKQFQDEISIYQNKIDRLESENKIMTQKLIQNAKQIFDKSIPPNNNNNFNNTSNILKNSSKQFHNNSNNIIHKQLGQTVLLRKNRSTSNIRSNNSVNNNNKMSSSNNQFSNSSLYGNNNNIQTNAYNARIFTLKMMKDTINEIYTSKVDFNKKCDENQLPRETMEQHMYTFLNHKYGLKTIIIEWATNIINGIKTFSSEDTEVCLFGKILRNELEEDARLFLPMLKTNVNNLLVMILKRKFPLKLMDDITYLKNNKINSTLTSDECREIIYNLYDEQDAGFLENKINEIIQKNKSILMNSTQFKPANFPSYYNNGKKKKLTREELILLEQEKENNANVIGYKEFIKLLHDFQIRSREKYLKNFVMLFKRVDKDNNGILNEEEFISFVNSFGLYNENFEEHIGRLLSMIDPYRNNQITFSECVSLFSMEIIEDKKNGDLSLLDKICIGDIIEENIEQEG